MEDDDQEKIEKALEHTLDIRKFEIELYWKRAAYFWTLIAAAFAGYCAILGSEHLDDKKYIAYIVAWVGFMFTWAWFLANRGSKFWQENWENHVDMLEDAVIGPLYKTVLSRNNAEADLISKLVTGPMNISVSKINQWISLFTLFIWSWLIYYSQMPLKGWTLYPPLAITAFMGFMMLKKGRSDEKAYQHKRRKRTSEIVN